MYVVRQLGTFGNFPYEGLLVDLHLVICKEVCVSISENPSRERMRDVQLTAGKYVNYVLRIPMMTIMTVYSNQTVTRKTKIHVLSDLAKFAVTVNCKNSGINGYTCQEKSNQCEKTTQSTSNIF